MIKDERPALSGEYLNIFLRLANEQGWDRTIVLHDTGIDEHFLQNHKNYVSFTQLEKIISNSHHYMTQPAAGLYMGQKLELSSHGILGMAAMGASTYLEAAILFRRFLKLRTQLVKISFGFERFCLVMKFELLHDFGEVNRFVIDSCLSGAFNVLKGYLGIASDIEEVRISYSQPSDIDIHRKIFGDIVRFAAQDNAIKVPLKPLLLATFSGSKPLQSIVTKECENLLSEQDEEISLARKISALLRQDLLNAPSQEKMAELLLLSTRTLRRRLQDEGTTYHEVIDVTKQELAIDLLCSTTLSIEEIARSVGYTETTNFNRAFKRWTGQSPSYFRTQSAL